MGLRSLVAKLMLDTQPYEQSLNRAGGFTDKWAGKQEKAISKAFFKAFGIMGAVKSLAHSFEEADRILTESGKKGISPEKFQALEKIAKSTGQSMEDLVKYAEKLPAELRKSVDEMIRLKQVMSNESVARQAAAGADFGLLAGKAGGGAAYLWEKLLGGVQKTLGGGIAIAGSMMRGGGRVKEFGEFMQSQGEGTLTGQREDEAVNAAKLNLLTAKKLEAAKEAEKMKFRGSFFEEIFNTEQHSMRSHTNSWQALGAYGGGQANITLKTTVKLIEKIERNTRPDSEGKSILTP